MCIALVAAIFAEKMRVYYCHIYVHILKTNHGVIFQYLFSKCTHQDAQFVG